MIAEDNIEYLEHMTDAYVRCKGKTLAESFQYSAKGLVNIMYDINDIEKKQKVSLFAEGFDLENLLFDWLEKVLLLLLIDKIIFDIKSRSTVVIPTERPVLERADDDSNKASTKSLLLR